MTILYLPFLFGLHITKKYLTRQSLCGRMLMKLKIIFINRRVKCQEHVEEDHPGCTISSGVAVIE